MERTTIVKYCTVISPIYAEPPALCLIQELNNYVTMWIALDECDQEVGERRGLSLSYKNNTILLAVPILIMGYTAGEGNIGGRTSSKTDTVGNITI